MTSLSFMGLGLISIFFAVKPYWNKDNKPERRPELVIRGVFIFFGVALIFFNYVWLFNEDPNRVLVTSNTNFTPEFLYLTIKIMINLVMVVFLLFLSSLIYYNNKKGTWKFHDGRRAITIEFINELKSFFRKK